MITYTVKNNLLLNRNVKEIKLIAIKTCSALTKEPCIYKVCQNAKGHHLKNMELTFFTFSYADARTAVYENSNI